MNTRTLIATLIILTFTFFAKSSFAQAYYGGWSSGDGSSTTYTTPNVYGGGYTSTTRDYSGRHLSTTEHTPNVYGGGFTSTTRDYSGRHLSTTEHTPNVYGGGFTSTTRGW